LEYTHEKKLSKLLKYCPINNSLEIIGKKTGLSILNSIEGNYPKTLSIRLKEMEKNELDREKSLSK
jgi:DNA-binding HxlR family transcriptional regulator